METAKTAMQVECPDDTGRKVENVRLAERYSLQALGVNATKVWVNGVAVILCTAASDALHCPALVQRIRVRRGAPRPECCRSPTERADPPPTARSFEF